MRMADVAPLLQKVAPIPIPPFMLNEKFYDALAEDLPLESNAIQPTAGLRAWILVFISILLTAALQHHGPSRENELAARSYPRPSPIVGSRQITQRTPWVRLGARLNQGRMP